MFGLGISGGEIDKKELVIKIIGSKAIENGKRKMLKKVEEKDYEDIYDCIVTDQVSPNQTAEYLEDRSFYKYYIKRRAMGGLWKKKKNAL